MKAMDNLHRTLPSADSSTNYFFSGWQPVWSSVVCDSTKTVWDGAGPVSTMSRVGGSSVITKLGLVKGGVSSHWAGKHLGCGTCLPLLLPCMVTAKCSWIHVTPHLLPLPWARNPGLRNKGLTLMVDFLSGIQLLGDVAVHCLQCSPCTLSHQW